MPLLIRTESAASRCFQVPELVANIFLFLSTEELLFTVNNVSKDWQLTAGFEVSMRWTLWNGLSSQHKYCPATGFRWLMTKSLRTLQKTKSQAKDIFLARKDRYHTDAVSRALFPFISSRKDREAFFSSSRLTPRMYATQILKCCNGLFMGEYCFTNPPIKRLIIELKNQISVSSCEPRDALTDYYYLTNWDGISIASVMYSVLTNEMFAFNRLTAAEDQLFIKDIFFDETLTWLNYNESADEDPEYHRRFECAQKLTFTVGRAYEKDIDWW